MTFWSQSLFTYDPHGHFSPGQDHPHWNSQLDKQYYRPCTLSTPSKASDFYNPDYGLLTPPASNPTTSAMATPDADEMEQFQRLSDQYQANLPGPLIGDKKPLSDLVTEYAQADETYVVKTTALAATHSAYRPIKGDGQCGWRGAVFGYFEILLKSGDLSLVTQELVRIQSFEQTIRAVGLDYDILIDMFDYTWELFDALKVAVGRGDSHEAVLLEWLNDETKSNSIVYHFKMMTSSFMQLQPDRYEPFLEMPVLQYCVSRIDPSNQEIDHIGLQALTDAVIAPAFIALEVSYLDRSTGDEVTAHQFVPNAGNWPTIRLIYRPGHYDIIYKDNMPWRVFLTDTPVYVSPYSDEIFNGDRTALQAQAALFPSAAQALAGSLLRSSSSTAAPQVGNSPGMVIPESTGAQVPSYFPQVQSNLFGQHALPPALPIRSHSYPQQTFPPVMLQPSAHIPPSPQSPQSQSPPITPSSGISNPSIVPQPQQPRIRYSQHCWNKEYEGLPLDPAAFAGFASSPAHFTNSEFQPEVWNAGEGYVKP